MTNCTPYDEQKCKVYSVSQLSQNDRKFLERAIQLALEAKQEGNYPFGALITDEQGTIIVETKNSQVSEPDCTGHAETAAIRAASRIYTADFLKRCTMYSSCEPCAMCTGAIYWGNLGRLVYACSEVALKRTTGNDPRNPTLALPCREVLACGQKDIEVIGPVSELEERYLELHEGFWDQNNLT